MVIQTGDEYDKNHTEPTNHYEKRWERKIKIHPEY